MRSMFIVLFMFLGNALFSEKVPRVYQKILNFDLGISHNLTNPGDSQGEQMIRDIEGFTDLLWEIRDKIKKKNKTVIQQVQTFVAQKTPVFLSHPLDEGKVKSAFSWDDDDLDVLFHVSKHSQVMWDEMKYWFKKTIAGNETYWLQ